MTDAYESDSSVYLPTKTIQTSFSSRSCLDEKRKRMQEINARDLESMKGFGRCLLKWKPEVHFLKNIWS